VVVWEKPLDTDAQSPTLKRRTILLQGKRPVLTAERHYAKCE
jgi:hypothetical protein